MPTYEYACKDCGIVEAFQSIKAAPLSACPQCGKSGVTRLFSGGGAVIFKGSGFWETDYNRGSAYAKAKQAEEPAAPSATAAQPKPAVQAAKPAAAQVGASAPASLAAQA